jgi:hypothetical protein
MCTVTYTIASTLPYPFGKEVIGSSRFGDGYLFSYYPRKGTCALSYTLSCSQYGSAVPLSYLIQTRNTAPLLLYYQVAAPSRFAINGDASIVRPDRVQYIPRSVTGRTLLGSPVLTGFSTVIWSYATLSWNEYHQIVAHYQPQASTVTITYPDEQGNWVQKPAVMHPPSYGVMSTMLVNTVVLTFSLFHTEPY